MVPLGMIMANVLMNIMPEQLFPDKVHLIHSFYFCLTGMNRSARRFMLELHGGK